MPRPCRDSDHENTLVKVLPSTVTGTLSVPCFCIRLVLTVTVNLAEVVPLPETATDMPAGIDPEGGLMAEA